jgi:hypothetical protein
MHYLAEDPWPLAGTLAFVALALFTAVRVTQQGKYLAWAGAALGLACLVVVVEKVWVTDRERIQRIVSDLARGAREKDVDGIMKHLTPDVSYGLGPIPLPLTTETIRDQLGRFDFDFVKADKLDVNVGERTRLGTAEFRVLSTGKYQGSMPFVMVKTEWSLGFEETAPHEWKVTRITAKSLPTEARGLSPFAGLGGKSRRGG